MRDKREKKEKKEKSPEAKRLYVSILLGLIAIMSLVAASVAWFSIANYTKVYSMGMDITTGTNLRFDLDPHEEYEDYVKTLKFSDIPATRSVQHPAILMMVTMTLFLSASILRKIILP